MTDDTCYLFGGTLDGRGGANTVDESCESVTPPHWAHIDYSSEQARGWLAARGLEPFVIDTLIRHESRPNMVAVDDGLLIVLRGINRNAGADPEDMVSLRIWIERDRMISVRQRQVIAAREVLAELEHGNGPKDLAELLTRLIERLADGIAVFVDDIEERMEQHEADVETGEPANIRSDVSAIRRQLATVRRYLAPQRDALDALFRQGKSFLDEGKLYLVREQSDRITRYVEDLDLVRERALVVQEELFNRISQEQNARTYVLSIVAAIFLPITFISGVFGMNVAGLPGLEDINSFWIVSGVMLAISVAILIGLRLKKWF
jgi:zinc transporter